MSQLWNAHRKYVMKLPNDGDSHFDAELKEVADAFNELFSNIGESFSGDLTSGSVSEESDDSPINHHVRLSTVSIGMVKKLVLRVTTLVVKTISLLEC